jgi:crossover junction endodeoxyribonuclease RuvC
VNALRILGLDPGIAIVGFGVIEAERGHFRSLTYGAIRTEAGLALSERLETIYNDLTQLLDSLQPDAVAIEELFFNTNITTGISVAHGRGILLLACRQKRIPVYEYTPLQVKQSVVGYGRAEKRQVMEMVRRMLHLDEVPKPDDAADALAIALCHGRAASSLLFHAGEKGQQCSTI